MSRDTHTVTPPEDGLTVEQLLRRVLRLSKTKQKRAKFAPDGLLLDGVRVRSTDRVRAGQVLAVHVPELEAGGTVPTEGALDLLYEDEWYLVVNKPAGLSVHPGPGHYADTLGNRLAWHAAERGEPFVLRLVNRLDKGTSGLLVAAKSAGAQEALAKALHTGAFSREYRAITEGLPPEEAGEITLPIGKVPGTLNVYRPAPDGLPARTHYRVLETRGGRALLALTLDTGRTHQIRVHLAALGCPLAGDGVYGSGGEPGRPALHSCKVSFEHPFTGARVECSAPLPEDLRALWTGSCPQRQL